MLREQVLSHFSARGWKVATDTTLGAPGNAFHPDLVLEKAGTRLAVRIFEEPAGTYQIGLFGAQCKRAKVKGVVVSESSPDVLDACENARVDFLGSESLGELLVVPTLNPSPRPPEQPPERPMVAFQELPSTSERVPPWRWAIVAVIWIAAMLALGYWLALIV